MGRGKIMIKTIENTNNRQVTFSKRRAGLIKKANELSVLCDCDIALIIFSCTGKKYDFVSSKTTMENMLQRYKDFVANHSATAASNSSNDAATVEHQLVEYNPDSDVNSMREELTKLRASCLQLQGKGLEGLNFLELQTLEKQLLEGIMSIRNKKERMLREQWERSKQQEEKISEENAALRKEVQRLRQCSKASCSSESNSLKRKRAAAGLSTDEGSVMEKEVESDQPFLSLGLPTTRFCGEVIPKTESTSNDSIGENPATYES
ncbi:agamous-like MADS-box protein AGL18 [Chenopodium quinoa]|uniref:Uncharacterized protein n=1 Tax=Chenopodium quinoa TaxID=63459 RepID=A0A803MAE4_CHEQI|nr:agamous-like MADS-box protein AGL18 [Chenopodium quinoa]